LCTCLDEPDCCYVCHEGLHQLRFAGIRPHVVRTAQSSMPSTAHPKQCERATNRNSTPISGATR
jgi:hypothetical protein